MTGLSAVSDTLLVMNMIFQQYLLSFINVLGECLILILQSKKLSYS